jgi:hypothetical protein
LKGGVTVNRYTQQLNDFLIEVKKEAIVSFSKTDTQYRELRKANTQNGLDVAGLLNKEDTQVFDKFREDTYLLHDIESDMLYLQGYRDCIRLLKQIELI